MSLWNRFFGKMDQAPAPDAAGLPAAPAKAPSPSAGLPLGAPPFPDAEALRAQLERPHLLPPLALAYVGDAVYELYVRRRVVAQGLTKPRDLHMQTVGYVRARSQAAALQQVMAHLTSEEQEVARRGRNAKPGHIPKGSNPAEYAQSSAFEALVGYLYLAGREERLGQLLEAAASQQERGAE